MKTSVYWMRRSLAARSATLLATTALTAILAMNTLPASAQLAWDGTNTTSGADGGGGTWSAGSATNWVDANGNNVAWINGSQAMFGDFSSASGAVQVVGTVEASSLNFNRTTFPNYSIYGGTVLGVGVAGTELFANGSLDVSTNLAGGDWRKTGTGVIRFLSANSYTGTTYINQGAIAISNANALGSAANGTIVASGAALIFNGNFTVANEALTLSGTGLGSGALTNNVSKSVWGGSVTLAADTMIGASGANQSLSLTGAVDSGVHALTFDVGANANGLISGIMSGTGALTKTGTGTLTLSGANSFTGATTIVGGSLVMGAQDALTASSTVRFLNGTWDLNGFNQTVNGLSSSSSAASVALGSAALTVNNAGNLTYYGGISGTGSLTKSGAGILTLGGVTSYTGSTAINGGILRTGVADALTQSAGIALNGGVFDLSGYNQTVGALNGSTGTSVTLGSATLTVDNTTNDSFWGSISGGGGLTKTGSGLLDLRSVNSYSGATAITGGTLRVAPGASIVNSSAISISNGGRLNLSAANALSSIAAVSLTGTGSQIGLAANQQIGSLAGTAATSIYVDQGVTLTTGTSNTSSVFAGNIGSNGEGNLVKIGSGSLTLSATNNYSGTTIVQAGSLIVNGSTAASSLTTVETGATLAGGGRVGATTIKDGGTLAAGAPVGTLHIDGNLTLEQGSQIAYEAGAPGADYVTPGTSDSLSVNGDLALNGAKLNVTDAGGFGAGLYRIFDYTGTLTMANGGLSIDQAPTGAPLVIQYLSADKQINLINVGNQTLGFWNANGAASPSQLGGGSGTWSVVSPVWSDENGTLTAPMQPQPGFAIFGGNAGTVTINNSAGPVQATGMQFAADGYRMNGDALTLIADADHPAPVEIRVGDGSAASGSYVTSIDNVITGSDGLNKTGAGTLVLNGANVYSGGTTLSAGRLSVSSDENLGAVNGGLTFTGGVLQLGSSFDLATARSVQLAAAGGTIDTNGFNSTLRREITGNGGLIKAGTGTLTLEGMNSFTGKTRIDAGGTLALAGQGRINASSGVEVNGTLDISAAAAAQIRTLSGSGSVVLGSNYLGIAQAAGVFSGAITGAGGVMVTGGNQVLTGSSTFSGSLGISEGAQVRIGDGGSAGAITGDINNWGTLVFDRSDALTYGGTITGAKGTLGITGGGTVTLTGANSYNGDTIIDQATLMIGNGGTGGRLGYGNTIFAGNSALVFNRSNSYSYGGALIGGGTLRQIGSGTTILAGDLTRFTGNTEVSGGTLQLRSLPSGDMEVASAATIDFALLKDAAYQGAMTGNGQLLKSTNSVLTLSGNNTGFTGRTQVDAGTLVITGSFGGDYNVGNGAVLIADGIMKGGLTVQSGGVLGGTGVLGDLTIEKGGVHAPGHSPGTQTIEGDYINHGTLLVDVTPDVSDRLVVTGAVDISGATLSLLLSPATAENWNPLNGPYTLIANQGSDAVLGRFAAVSKNLLFLNETLDYAGGDGNDVTLQLKRNDVGFDDVAATRNQRNTARAIASLPSGNAVWNAIALQPDDQSARAAFDALSGEIHASAKSGLINDSHFLRDAINDRLRAAFAGAEVKSQSGSTANLAAWGQALGSWGRFKGDDNTAAFDTSTGGFVTGFDTQLGDTSRLGLVAGYSHLSMHAKDRSSSASAQNLHLGVYGGSQFDAISLRAGAAYSFSALETSRYVGIPGLTDVHDADYNASTLQLFGELGYRINTSFAVFEPFANLAYVNLHTDGFSETGGAAALKADSNSTHTTFTTIGLRSSSDFTLNHVTGIVNGMVGWRHAYGDLDPATRLSFEGSDGFQMTGVAIGKNAAVIELGIDFNLAPNTTLGAAYRGQFLEGAIENGFNTKLAVKF
ncbi:autotransporter domain-containing protein [Ochrobactrum sp. AN78]|uniref:autotransporter domain-containing protein n=1 Tax=Ochrobactrum sp. AN78 TaxID=3039853 RepID=UPI002989D548|nr:autotransporter domain-containing protein [Ochrobactrum sp. AN78]MDH7792568.1 fibronectin-binding autotransporter adhesin [Ochrobactrum sp. AN78]